MPTDYDVGVLVGLLVGEGHFGGDGRQPQITLRMHVRHEALFLWLERTFPGGKLYGPYHHGERHYFQWMARGPYLRDVLFPLLRERVTPDLDAHCHRRFLEMQTRYARSLGLPAAPLDTAIGDRPAPTSSAGEPAPRSAPPAAQPSIPDPGDQASTLFDRLRGARPD
jgi:hypothetical protein